MGLVVGPNAAYWLGRDRQRLSDEALHKQLAEQRGKYASLGNVGPATPANQAEISTVGGDSGSYEPDRLHVGDVATLNDEANRIIGAVLITGIPPEPPEWRDKWYSVRSLTDILVHEGTGIGAFIARRPGEVFHVQASYLLRLSTVGGTCRRPCCVRGAALLAHLPAERDGTH